MYLTPRRKTRLSSLQSRRDEMFIEPGSHTTLQLRRSEILSFDERHIALLRS